MKTFDSKFSFSFLLGLKKSIGQAFSCKTFIGLGLVAVMSAATPFQASAEGFGIQDWSARGAALAGGLVARGGEASVLAYNPAAITELDGTQLQVGLEVVAPINHIKFNNTGAKYKSNDSIFVLPHAYVTHKINDAFSFGFGTFTRFGLGNGYDHNWQGSVNMYDVEVQSVTMNPVLAWRINDKFSLAAGIEIIGLKVTLDRYIPGSSATKVSLDHDSIEYGFGINLAAHYRVNDQWNIGFSYRPGMDIDIDGNLVMSSAAGVQSLSGKTTMSFPDQFSLGIAYFPNDKWSFEFDTSYYVWSTFKDLNLHVNGLGTLESIKNWQDTWFFAASAEYQMKDWLALRAGISYETSPHVASHAEYLTPVNGRWKYSLGAGFAKNNWAVDIAYVYHDVRDSNYVDRPSEGVYAGKAYDVYANAFLLSFSYKF